MEREQDGVRVGETTNKYGTPVSEHLCFGCGSEFTVCPPHGNDWGGCLAETCVTYDESRDIDKHWDDPGNHIVRRELP